MKAHTLTAFTPLESGFELAVPDPLKRTDWVDMQLVKSFMQHSRNSMVASSAVTWIMAGVLYKSAPAFWLLAWLVLSNLLIFARYKVAIHYQKSLHNVSGPKLRAFLARYDFLWILGGVLWGGSSLLFVGKASGFEQFICGLILIGVSCFTLYSYAPRLQCFLTFSNSLSGTALGVFIYRLSIDQSSSWTPDSLSLIALMIVFHFMLRYFAIRINRLQYKSLQFQFDNDILIKSLTAKSKAALDAVENKNRFIASAAHDLRQPVHALNLYASWLADEPELGPQVAPQIVRCTVAVNELFNSLFDFSGLNGHKPQVNWQQVNLNGLLVDLKHQFAPVAQENGLQLRLHAGSTDTITVSDPVLLKRLLGNLISNALKNTQRGGMLLALRQSTGPWRIEVWDTGVGVEPEHQKAIFKEFYRVPRQGTEDGFGLGLTISGQLAQVLGLGIRVRSRPGRGSVFWIEQRIASSRQDMIRT